MPQGDRHIPHPSKQAGRMLLISIVVLGLVGFRPAWAATASKADKTELLKEKLSAMETLRGQMGIKLFQASAIRSNLKSRIDPLELELKSLSEHYQFTAFDQAGAHPGIAFGLKTLAHFDGYYQAILGVIRSLREADHTLQYLHQQVRDDLEVIATLSDLAIEAQIDRIDAALDFPQAHQAHLIDAAQVTPPSPEAVFNRLMVTP